MTNRQDYNLFRGLITAVIDEIRIFARHKLANSLDRLPTPDLGKQDKVLQ